MKTHRNPDNDRLTIRIEPEIKQEIIRVAEQLDVSVGWIIKRAWKIAKESLIKLSKS